tara:strand:+ start:2856 stop:3056 length:201 start_codon:yes stop_codon:yes gene_type:complete
MQFFHDCANNDLCAVVAILGTTIFLSVLTFLKTYRKIQDDNMISEQDIKDAEELTKLIIDKDKDKK